MDSSHTCWPGNGLNLPIATDHEKQQELDMTLNLEIRSTLDLLERGESQIKLSNESRDVVLVLGNTGSGKTTFTQWITGNDTKLVAEEVKEGSGEFIIHTGDGIGNPTATPKTIFPELVVDTETNTVFYDCPGFSNTGNTSNDMAATYFIKKVLDLAKSVKVAFIVNHFSVRKGGDKEDFMKLLRHATDIVKDIDKFGNSFALIATKVDNQYVKQGDSLSLVNDYKVIKGFSNFLEEVKSDLLERETLPLVAEKDKIFYSNAVKFINKLVAKDDNFTKLGIFRRPNETGLLSNITLLQDGKMQIKKLINERLTFTPKCNDDFGYTISEKSKNYIHDTMMQINRMMWFSVSEVAKRAQEYHHDLMEQIQKKIDLVLNNTGITDADHLEAKAIFINLRNACNITSNAVEQIMNMRKPEKLTEEIRKYVSDLGIKLPGDIIINITNQGKLFHFLQLISDEELITNQWPHLFKGVVRYFMDETNNIQETINDSAVKVNNKIVSNLSAIAKAIQEHYHKKVEFFEMQKLPEEFNRDRNFIRSMIEQMRNLTTTKKLLKVIRKNTNDLGIIIQDENLLNIAHLGKYLKFLKILSDDDLNAVSLSWSSPFHNVADYLGKLEKWYEGLNYLYGKLSEYEVQRDRQKYSIVEIEDWDPSDKPQGIEIIKSTHERFLFKTSLFNAREFENASNTTQELVELNRILTLTLKHEVSIQCREPYIFIKGDYISTRYINAMIKSNTDCWKFLNGPAPERFKFISIFALNTVFVDENLAFGQGLPITLIAPKWEVIGTRLINLSGSEGQPNYRNFNVSCPAATSKAKDGTSPGSSGEDGNPGGAGGHGGTFFGIGDEFVNGASLTILANGGVGGSGQDGGDGRAGTDGVDADLPCDDINGKSRAPKAKRCAPYHCLNYPTGKGTINGFDCDLISNRGDESKYKMFGIPGRKGGSGGDGGRGGKGGNPGKIIMFELSKYSEISKRNNTGKDGADGRGGTGAASGNNGNDVVVHCTFYANLFSKYDRDTRSAWFLDETITNPRSSPGSNGKDGANVRSKRKSHVYYSDIGSGHLNIINEYKIYLRENLNDHFRKSSLMRFLDKLESNQRVKNMYDTLGLIKEFHSLEEQFNTLNNDVDFVPFYKSLLNRISDYAKTPKPNENNVEYKKVLSFLYTAALGRISSMKTDSDSILIIDIKGYLDTVKKDIEILKDLKNARNKADIINKSNQNYKKGVDRKIDEAKSFIQKQIIPEMDTINNQIDNQMQLLINETIDLQKQVKEEKDALMKKKQQLESTLVLRGLLGCFQIVGQVIGFLGPVGAAVGSVVGAVTSVSEQALVLDNQQPTVKLPKALISNLRSLANQTKTLKDKKISQVSKLLQEIEQEINKYPEMLNDVVVKIVDIKGRLSELKGKKFVFEDAAKLEEELKDELKRKEVELNSKKVSTDKKAENALKVVKRLNKVVQLGSNLLAIYSQITNDKTKLDAVISAIEQAEAKFQRLKQYEETIYKVIIPVLQNMEDTLLKVADKLDSKSQVALDITKWQVQSALKDVKLQMRHFTEGFEMSDSLARCLEMLEEAVTTLINIYDRIRNYQEQQNLANFIADVSSTTSSVIHIKDLNLSRAVNRAEELIRSNLVLKQYKIVIDAFKQWVFPFVDHYLEDSALPQHLETEKNIETLVSKAMTEIEKIKSQVDVYKTSVKVNDKYIQYGEFSSNYISTQPFYVWKNEQFKSVLRELLSGKEVVLKADVKGSPAKKDAIKFNSLELHLKSNNSTLQNEINHALKSFDLKATHLGNSYYRYANNIYLITCESQTILYSFEKNAAGEPVRKNSVYDKIKKGDLMLSPYTLWQLKIVNATDRISFGDLEIYEDDINLELSGYGSYVDMNLHMFNLLKGKYQVHETFNALDVVLEDDKYDCIASNPRHVRSVDQIQEIGNQVTNNASPGFSSPINYVCNLLNIYIVSNIISPPSRIFISRGENLKNCNLNDNQNEDRGAIDNNPILSADIIRKYTGDYPSNNARSAESILFENAEVSRRDGIEKECTVIAPSVLFFAETNNYSESSLPNGQDHYKDQFLQVPEINSTLLLADLITRSITGSKYKSGVDESLLSPQQVILRKINNGCIQSESDINKMLSKSIPDVKDDAESSWHSKIKNYAKSVFHILGFVKAEDTEDYIQDLRKLFV